MTRTKALRVLIPTLLVTALAALGCAGMGGSAPSDPARGTPDAKTGKHGKARGKGEILVGASSIQHGKPEKLPTGATVERARRKDLYVVKLAKGVHATADQQGLHTGDAHLDSAFASLGITDARPVHRRGAKNKQAAESLGLGRTLRIRSAKPMDKIVSTLEDEDSVDWVEPVTEMRAHATAPNDPYWIYQWNMQNLRVNEAWTTTMGEGVVVAVVDTGVTANEDGFFKLLSGYDFVDDDANPDDMNGHGSHVAGTIGQATNNGIGVAGVAPKVSILPVRVLDANGAGDNTDVAEGIIWAVDNGANVINLSLGSPAPSEVVEDAVAYAYEHDVTVVCATGNDGFTDFVSYPAAYRTTIAVGSVDLQNQVAFYSNQGKEIDLVGPGGDTSADRNGDGQVDGVLQETRMADGWGYYQLQGTSMATPHVSGVAALVYSTGVHDPDDVRDVLRSTASDLGAPGWDTVYGAGLVNPVGAVSGHAGGHRRRGGSLEISSTEVKRAGRTRAVITWTTTEPAGTVVRSTTTDFERKDDNPTKYHEVVVRGRPGTTATYTIASAAGPRNRAKDTVTVTF